MAQQVGRLNALQVSRAKSEGMHPDGAGLYLQVTAGADDSVAKSWLFRYTLNGKARAMGLGSLKAISLSQARKDAAECRRLLQAKIDPIEDRKEREAQARAAAAGSVTFKAAAEAHIKAHSAGWRNAKHAAQWTATLTTYAYPEIGPLPVRAVDTSHILKILESIWQTKTETASRLRGRIEAILDGAKARGERSGENPARWRGHLQNLLPKRVKVRRVRHHPALPWTEIGAFMVKLRQEQGIAAAALEFAILTAARTSEVIGALWKEIDLDEAVWTVPANRIKGEKEHRVPLSDAAVTLLKGIKRTQDRLGEGERFVFPGDEKGKHLSNMAMLALLARMKRDDVTVHGFRSTFRDWAAECTNYPREVAEMALAHVVDDKVEAAYRRGDLFDKRRRLMDEWAKFCGTVKTGGQVVTLHRRKAR